MSGQDENDEEARRLEAMARLCDEIYEDDGQPLRQRSRSPGGGRREEGGAPSYQRKVHRKRMQLCAEVERAINLSLSTDFDDPLLQCLQVHEVEPWPDDSQLRVTVWPQPSGGEGLDLGEIRIRLDQNLGRLRHEIARCLHRKQTPQIFFRVLPREVLYSSQMP